MPFEQLFLDDPIFRDLPTLYQPSQPMWISVLAAISLGPIVNIFRITSVNACQEFDYREGSAGVIGNVMSTAFEPFLQSMLSLSDMK